MIILTILLVVVGFSVLATLAAAARQPRSFQIARSITTSAPSDRVYGYFRDLANWRSWSPYDGRDPAMETSLSTPSHGVGATYAWNGNRNVGAGKLTITNDTPGSSVEMDLEFDRPFKCRNHVTWKVEDEGGSRRISWVMDGRNDDLMPRVFGLFMNMDTMVGNDFETGLATLKGIVENPS
jgi:hypothetical protein